MKVITIGWLYEYERMVKIISSKYLIEINYESGNENRKHLIYMSIISLEDKEKFGDSRSEEQ